METEQKRRAGFWIKSSAQLIDCALVAVLVILIAEAVAGWGVYVPIEITVSPSLMHGGHRLERTDAGTSCPGPAGDTPGRRTRGMGSRLGAGGDGCYPSAAAGRTAPTGICRRDDPGGGLGLLHHVSHVSALPHAPCLGRRRGCGGEPDAGRGEGYPRSCLLGRASAARWRGWRSMGAIRLGPDRPRVYPS
jgi:hypothetical protein